MIIHLSPIRKASIVLIAGLLLISPVAARSAAQTAPAATTDSTCRFGITSALGSEGYDIASIGVGAYLDWGVATNPDLPPGMEYIRVVRVRDDIYPQYLANLPEWVDDNPGSVWVVGNEPDTYYEGQDGVLAEVYADRYYELAQIIREHDPTALIAFGPVVQPTPIRMRYLERAWVRLGVDAGSSAAASQLIDIWSPHSFILNEQAGGWGAGIPPGFENDDGDAVIITDLADTYSIDIFEQRIIAFRGWLASIGERDKPVWISEYGSLLPPVNRPDPPYYYTVSDEDTAAYMVDTFDFMLAASDPLSGMPGDGDRLVQRWFWYSLNDHRYKFGGSLFNPDFPDYGERVTWVGHSFIDYQALELAEPDLFPVSLAIAPISFSEDRSRVNYRLFVRVGNGLKADTGASAEVWIYDGDPEAGGTLIGGPIAAEVIQRCGGSRTVSAAWNDVPPLAEHTLYVKVEPVGVADSNPGNNQAWYNVYLGVPKLTFMGVIYR